MEIITRVFPLKRFDKNCQPQLPRKIIAACGFHFPPQTKKGFVVIKSLDFRRGPTKWEHRCTPLSTVTAAAAATAAA
jgi:hypothetical protein